MPYDPPPLSDPRVLRAVAHPTRGRILDELGATGPMRAADVGDALGIPANQASFHLRQLAKYGVVVPAPEAARDRRDRVWKLPDERGYRLSVKEMEAQPGGKAAVALFRRTQSARAHQLVDAIFDFTEDKGAHKSLTEQALRLTKDEAAELMGEIDEVVARWAAGTRGRSRDKRTYVLYTMLQPLPERSGT